MESLFFGPSSAPLYGVYCAPRPGRERPEGIVFCYPFGQEYMRAHRALRLLAINLSDLGYHVLRFDYRGTGDSSGDIDGLALSDWVEDTAAAVQELRDMTAVNQVSLVGLRLGGLIAALAACHSPGAGRLALWDPVTDGNAYLEELKAGLQQQTPEAACSNFIDADGAIHLNGFSLPRRFQQSLGEQNLGQIDIGALGPVLELVSHEAPCFSQLASAWAGFPNFDYQLQPAPHDWNYVDNFGSILLPQPMMAAIRAWFQ